MKTVGCQLVTIDSVDMAEIDVTNIVSGRTRGKKIDYAKEAAAAGKDLVEDDEEDDEEYVHATTVNPLLTCRGRLLRTLRNSSRSEGQNCQFLYQGYKISHLVCWMFALDQLLYLSSL